MKCFGCNEVSQDIHLRQTATGGQVPLCSSCEADAAELDFQSTIVQYEVNTFSGADDSVLYGPYSRSA